MQKIQDDAWFLGALLTLFILTYASFYWVIPALVNLTFGR